MDKSCWLKSKIMLEFEKQILGVSKLSGTIIIMRNKTKQTDGVAVSSLDICQGTPVSVGCAPCLFFVF